MDEKIKCEAIHIILRRFRIDGLDFEKISQEIKLEMDEKIGGNWHCITGKGFGFEVTFNSNHLIYLCIAEEFGVVLWQC